MRERNIGILMCSGYGQQVHVPFIVQKITWINRLGAVTTDPVPGHSRVSLYYVEVDTNNLSLRILT